MLINEAVGGGQLVDQLQDLRHRQLLLYPAVGAGLFDIFEAGITIVLFASADMIDRAIDQNTTQPGLKAHRGLEFVHVAKNLHEGIVQHFLRFVAALGIGATYADAVGTEAAVELTLGFGAFLSAGVDQTG